MLPDPGARDYLSTNEAAELLGITVPTLRCHIADGTLAAYRLGRRKTIRIKRADLEALLTPIPASNVA